MTTPTNSEPSNTSAIPTPPTTTSPTGYENKPANETPEVEDNNLDPYGYEKIPETKPTEETKPAEESKPTEEVKVEDATGYGEPKEEVKPTEEPAAEGEKTPEVLNKEAIEAALGTLPEGYNKEAMSKFALDNKFTEEQTKAYVDFAKADSEQLEADRIAQVKAKRDSWTQELKNDSLFGGVGGENFDKSVHSANKMMTEYFPNFKKALTDSGGMMPPYIMKDLLAMSGKLNPTTEFVPGKPGEPKAKEENTLDIMYS